MENVVPFAGVVSMVISGTYFYLNRDIDMFTDSRWGDVIKGCIIYHISLIFGALMLSLVLPSAPYSEKAR